MALKERGPNRIKKISSLFSSELTQKEVEFELINKENKIKELIKKGLGEILPYISDHRISLEIDID